MRTIKEELKKELIPIIARQVYVDLRAEEINDWLMTNLRDIFHITPALPGFFFLKQIVFEMLRGAERTEAIKMVAENNLKTVEHVKRQIARSISTGNARIKQIKELEPERCCDLRFDKLPNQPNLIKLIFDECVTGLKLRL